MTTVTGWDHVACFIQWTIQWTSYNPFQLKIGTLQRKKTNPTAKQCNDHFVSMHYGCMVVGIFFLPCNVPSGLKRVVRWGFTSQIIVIPWADPGIRRGGFTTPISLKPHPNDPFKGRGTYSRVKFGQSDVTAQLI